MSSKRNALMMIGILMVLETWQILGQVSHNFTLLEEKAPDRYTWSGRGLTRKQLTSRPDHLWPELWKSMGKHAKLKEKQKWSNEKLHLENARILRGIYFIDPEDEKFEETIKNARKKLETSVAPAMPCKIIKNCGSGASNNNSNKTCVYSGSWWIHKNAYGKFDTASSRRPYCKKRWEVIAAQQFGSQVYSYAFKLSKLLQRKQRWTKNGKNWSKFRRGTWQKFKVRSDRWSKDVGRYSSLCIMNGHMSSAKCWIGGKAPKIQRSSCTPSRHCKRRFRVVCSIHWTRIFSISNDSS